MNLSLSNARKSCLVWMFWFFGAWLVLETGSLFVAVWLFNIPAHQLVAPYIALAVPPAVIGPFIYRINRRPVDYSKRRAHNMATASTVFYELWQAALFYSSVKLGLLSVNDAISTAIVMCLFGGPIVYFGAYHTALAKAARGK